MDGGDAATRNHRRNALRYGQRSVLHSPCRPWMPKHIGNDMWDVAMERRDKKLIDQATLPSSN